MAVTKTEKKPQTFENTRAGFTMKWTKRHGEETVDVDVFEPCGNDILQWTYGYVPRAHGRSMAACCLFWTDQCLLEVRHALKSEKETLTDLYLRQTKGEYISEEELDVLKNLRVRAEKRFSHALMSQP